VILGVVLVVLRFGSGGPVYGSGGPGDGSGIWWSWGWFW
jgi:hypothetical protein